MSSPVEIATARMLSRNFGARFGVGWEGDRGKRTRCQLNVPIYAAGALLTDGFAAFAPSPQVAAVEPERTELSKPRTLPCPTAIRLQLAEPICLYSEKAESGPAMKLRFVPFSPTGAN